MHSLTTLSSDLISTLLESNEGGGVCGVGGVGGVQRQSRKDQTAFAFAAVNPRRHFFWTDL